MVILEINLPEGNYRDIAYSGFFALIITRSGAG